MRAHTRQALVIFSSFFSVLGCKYTEKSLFLQKIKEDDGKKFKMAG
jgi:hypothetical protein